MRLLEAISGTASRLGVMQPEAIRFWRNRCSLGTPLADAVKLAMVSMDSTIRSNLTVGLPMVLLLVRRGDLRIGQHRCIGADDAYYDMVHTGWSDALRQAYLGLPRPDWA